MMMLMLIMSQADYTAAAAAADDDDDDVRAFTQESVSEGAVTQPVPFSNSIE